MIYLFVVMCKYLYIFNMFSFFFDIFRVILIEFDVYMDEGIIKCEFYDFIFIIYFLGVKRFWKKWKFF